MIINHLKVRSLLLRSSSVAIMALGATQVSAQTVDEIDQSSQKRILSAQAQTNTQSDAVNGPLDRDIEQIVVTGSRIATPNVLSSIPVTSISADDLRLRGDVSLGDALNDLPALRSTFSQANSTRFIGTAGLNLLDLRGLGTSRTLVLVNGRRHITATPGDFNVDTNTIPSDLLERTDVVTGGNSAIYGSDAVAGVVNFIMKRDFEGISARAQGGISDRGDRESYFASLTAGTNFDDNRGNIAGSVEYSKSKVLFFTERDNQTGALTGRSQFNVTQNTIGEGPAGDGIPDRSFLMGVRNNNISEGGLYTSSCPTAVPSSDPNFAAVEARRAFNCNGLLGNTGSELGRTFVFDDNGTLIPNPIISDLRPFGSGNSIGGLGSTLRLTGMLQPGLERYSGNFLSSYEVSEAFRPFIEAKYVRIESLQEGQPTFHFNVFNTDNPFLNDASRAVLQQSLAPGATAFGAFRFNVDFGGRGEEHKRETYRIVVGADGTFNEDWSYEVAANFGKVTTFFETNGNIDNAKFAAARDAVLDANDNIVCAINTDADPNNDDPACVPVNLFGFGAPSQAALDYFVVNSFRDEKATQFDVTAFISGDSSQLFELPGGPIGFALGGEYRRETASAAFDPFTASGATFLNAIAEFDPPSFETRELFGEVRAPILSGQPFIEELTFEASGRYSDYKGAVGSVFAYNFGGVYSPISDIRIRAGYARSVRSPTLSDQFSAGSQTFVNGLQDPCSAQNIDNNPNRRANCAAFGVPATEIINGVEVPWTNLPASGVSGLQGGNPNVTEEKGKSLTIGFVATPRFIDGLTASVDYYDITLNDVIFTLNGQTIIDQCFDNPSGINNPFCAAVFRNPDGTFQGQSDRVVGGSTLSFPTTGQSFLAGPFNFARQETTGIDIDLNYRTQLFETIQANFRGIGSYVIKRNNFTDIDQPDFKDRLKSELGDPAWAISFTANLAYEAFSLNYNMRYVGRQTIDDFETQNSVQGRPPENPDAFPSIFHPAVAYHNFRLSYDINENFQAYGGVDNLFDRLPPDGLLGTGGGDSIFENVGRFFYFGVMADF